MPKSERKIASSETGECVAARGSETLFIDGVIGCLTFDPHDVVNWSNSRVSDLLGLAPPELTGKPLLDLCCDTPEGKEKAKKILSRLHQGREIHDEQLQMCRADGQPQWVSINLNASRDEQGRVIQGSATLTDISQHKRTEEVLQRNFDAQKTIDSILRLSLGELDIREILDSTLDLLFLIPWLAVESKGSIFLIDDDGGLTMVSQYGMSKEIVTACSRIPMGRCLCGRAARTGEVIYAREIDERHEIQYEGITSHGHYCIPLISRGRVIGVLNCYLGVGHLRDEAEVRFLSSVAKVLAGVIERRRAEQALQKSEEKYRSLFEESQDVVFISTPEGRFVDVNPAACRLFGFASEQQLLSADGGRIPYLNPGDPERIRMAIEQHGFVRNYELVMKTNDGDEVNVFMTANAVRDDSGSIVAHSGFIRDMTDFKKLEAQLIQAQRMESIGRLAGGLSHDLNNYLTAIQGYTDLALMALNDDSPVIEDLRESRKSADRATALTKQLLLFSRREPMEISQVQLNTVVNDLLSMLRQLVGEQFIIKTDLAGDLREIRADTSYIEQVIMNLVVNARDAMPSGGEITIATTNVDIAESYSGKHPGAHAGRFACLSVKDTGVGMVEKVLNHIFEPFFSTKKVGKGTGLGLSVVHGIVSQHGGWIDVESEPGKGSAFMVYLPAGTPRGRKPEAAAAPCRSAGGEGEKILLVEDNQHVRAMTKKMLAGAGYQVCAVATAEQALTLFADRKGDFQLVLSDVVLPHQNGVQLANQLRKEKPGLGVLLMSGYSDEYHRKAIQEKGYAFIHKPFKIPDLKQSIHDILATAREPSRRA